MNALPSIISIQAHGRIMDIANPTKEDIVWSDIASSLSKIARFNGAYTSITYSVAQHCVMGADAVFDETNSGLMAGYFLLHDAHEAIFGDLPRPSSRLVQMHLAQFSTELGKLYDVALERSKATLDEAIYAKANLVNLHDLNVKNIIADMDDRMLRVEVRTFFGADAETQLPERQLAPVRLKSALKPWPSMKAEEVWLERLQRYLNINPRGL